jgi:hypothetical protein
VEFRGITFLGKLLIAIEKFGRGFDFLKKLRSLSVGHFAISSEFTE